MARYGLPTFPIADGMIVGNRPEKEIEWLLDHGVFQSDIIRYWKLYKDYKSRTYKLSLCIDGKEEVKREEISLAPFFLSDNSSWYWYGDKE